MARLILLILLLAAAPAAAQPRRIVSLDLCADQLVLALADRAQIAAVTRNAVDPALSAFAARARGVPLVRGGAEGLLALDPDLVVAMPGIAPPGTDLLRRRGVRFVDAPDAASYAAIRTLVEQVAAGIGRLSAGADTVRRMDSRLAALPRNPGRGRVAAYYQRRGFMTGGGTLVDDLFGRVGLVNLATRLGKPPLSQLSLEELVAAQPDVIVLERDSMVVADQGTEMLHHPALRNIPRIWLPQAWTVCGSPAYVFAAESLARQLGGR